MRKSVTFRVLVSLLSVAFILVMAMPRTAKFSYDYKKGSPWKHETLFAQFDFPILKSEAQILEESGKSFAAVVPYYRYSSETVSRSVRDLERMDLGELKADAVSALRSIYDKGVISDEGVKKHDQGASSDVLYIQKDKHASLHPASEVYRLSSAREKLLSQVSAGHPSVSVDSIFREAGVYSLVVPNLLYDKQTSELLHEQSGHKISQTDGYVSAGQLIVSNGEIVTAEIAQMLDSYKQEYEDNLGYAGPKAIFWLGNMMLALIMVSLLFFAIHFTKSHIVNDSRYFYILTVFLIFALLALVVCRIGDNMLFMVPFTLAAMFYSAFFRPKVILPVYAVTLLPLLIFSRQGVLLFTMFYTAGIVSVYTFHYFKRGWKQFVAALITFAVLAFVFLAFKFADLASGNVLRRLVYLFVASMLTVAGYPLVYLFEKIFNLVSSSRLMELSDTSNKLLLELEQKAPGTLQHSLQVMNMSDAVARSIGANRLLVRAGALYHDIGKMCNPQCFVENESLMNKEPSEKYHAGLTPLQSAKDIIRHVTDGVELAHKNNLPDVVTDFILTHHGTTTMSFFFHEHLKQGGSPEDEDQFRYEGKKPRSKEQIILMLCDSIEAASRTLKDYSQESFSKFVDSIVQGKMDAGQFEDADISISELGTVREEIKSYLARMYHDRIAYPTKSKSIK